MRRGNFRYYERKARQDGFRAVAGVDEAGRGPLAGPVVAAAVILGEKRFRNRIDDSKRLSDRMRRTAFDEIRDKTVYGVGIVERAVIDRINIYQATILAMERAVLALSQKPDYLLIDGKPALKSSYESRFIIGGDSLSISIAAASIVAKVTRDDIMVRCHSMYPNYGFERHKGYGTREHFKAIRRHGLSPIHRRSFNLGIEGRVK